ncbi:hypothetical protein DB32_008194 [Sandaracinus amylolyticus]|uniref:Uncharacterized protein n=1 Tax=Sandaracinus amylolyticus TaxID=927083 RepID=A0A0F6YMS8_9BACT|nr:hypothetical protein DB32_008194 [Sandaracinus amylolyticus]
MLSEARARRTSVRREGRPSNHAGRHPCKKMPCLPAAPRTHTTRAIFTRPRAGRRALP